MAIPSGRPFLDVISGDDAYFNLVTVSYDGTSTYKKGSDKGPEAIVDASAYLELYDIETETEPFRHGIKTARPNFDLGSPERMVESVYHYFRPLFRTSMFPIALGGEHSISIGIVRAAVEAFPDLRVLQFDAHADLRDEYEGSRYNHACVMARISELCNIVQCGIRSMDISEKDKSDAIFFAADIVKNERWYLDLRELLSTPVYITFDLDVFDPGIIPSTGTPEPGGLDWYAVLVALRWVFGHCNVIGADIVELCPDGNHASEFTAAKLVYKMMAYQAQNL